MPDENLPALLVDADVAREVIKHHGGMWLPGQSGNPAGRPRGSKNRLVELKRELELAVRDNLNPKVIRGILERMAEMALAGDVKAAKLILDKVLTNASEGEEEGTQQGTFVFQVKNLTLKHDAALGSVHPVIDVTPITITPQEITSERAEQPTPQRPSAGRQSRRKGSQRPVGEGS